VIQAVVTEYQAEVLEDDQGQRDVAPFPEGVTRPLQYGPHLKAHGVYLSPYPLLPYARIRELLTSQCGLALSNGTLFAFNQEAYPRAESFAEWVIPALREAPTCMPMRPGCRSAASATGCTASPTRPLTWLAPHPKRGQEAMDAIGVLPFEPFLIGWGISPKNRVREGFHGTGEPAY
jgi:transposase